MYCTAGFLKAMFHTVLWNVLAPRFQQTKHPAYNILTCIIFCALVHVLLALIASAVSRSGDKW